MLWGPPIGRCRPRRGILATAMPWKESTDALESHAGGGGRTRTVSGARDRIRRASDRITPATLGLSIAEGKAVLAAIQAQLVADQVTRHGVVARECRACGRVQASKGHYRSTFRSVFGNVPLGPSRGYDNARYHSASSPSPLTTACSLILIPSFGRTVTSCVGTIC
jgi:hypothetical protein